MKLDNIKIFIIVTLIVGTIFSILFPLYQIPDEIAHINMIYEELNNEIDIEGAINDYGDTYRIIRNPNEKVNIDKYFDLSKKIDSNYKLSIPNINILKHFPQSIGIIIGEIFDLPILVIITLSELLGLLFYTSICALSLKLLPFKKYSFIFIMLLPLSIQQMGSFSYDVTLVPLCFLFISYILHLKFTKKEITLKDILLLLLLIGIITIIKLPYLLLIFLIIILPIKKLSINLGIIKINEQFIKKNKLLIIISLIILFILGILVMTKILYGKILLAFLLSPISLIKTLVLTLIHHGPGYIFSALANFGWYDTRASIIYPIIIIIFGLFISLCNYNKINDKYKIEENKFKKWEIIYIILLFIMISSILIISLYEWSIKYNGFIGFDNYSLSEIINYIRNNNEIILGVQGRYFIPLLPLLFIVIYNKNITNKIIKIHPNIIQIGYYIFMITYMFILILNRYWR